MEALAASLGLSVLMLVVLSIALLALFPLFWVWMLVDCVIRDTDRYPSKDSAEKVLWILLLVLVQPAAIVYFAMVWNPGRTTAPGSSTAVPVS